MGKTFSRQRFFESGFDSFFDTGVDRGDTGDVVKFALEQGDFEE